MSSPQKIECRVAVLGAGAVGKSTITNMFVLGKLVNEYDPTIEDPLYRTVTVDGEEVHMEILDTAGQNEFRETTMEKIGKYEGFLLVYALNDRYSFEEAERIRQMIVDALEDAPVVLCGNKNDLENERVVPKDEGEEMARQWNAPFFETCGKQASTVEEPFIVLARLVRQAQKRPVDTEGRKKKKVKKGCNVC